MVRKAGIWPDRVRKMPGESCASSIYSVIYSGSRMKYIKYDERGKQSSSEETKMSMPEKPAHLGEQIHSIEPTNFRHLVRGAIVGLAAGVPIGALVELVRVIMRNPWDEFLVGGIVTAVVVILSVGIAYFYHKA